MEVFSIGGKTYKRFFGIDFPDPEMTRTFAALTIAKKHHLMRERGLISDVDPGDCLEEALGDLFKEHLVMTTWTQQMIHDSVHEDYYAMMGCAACGKSHAMAALGIGFWIVDPFDTSVIVGSNTLTDLQLRAWSPMLELFAVLEKNAEFEVPGKISRSEYAIRNIPDKDIPESQTARGAIVGKALDDGRMQGTHSHWVMLVVDELGIVTHLDALRKGIINIRTGTLGFKYISAANPNPWDSPNSRIYIPPKGVVVTPDTGTWTSEMGYKVRHFNGYKSPVVLNPALKAKASFLMSRENIAQSLKECGGDPNHPDMWKMVVGFPLPSGGGTPPVLDPMVAAKQEVTKAMPDPMISGRRRVGQVAGIDPAWSEHGDDAIYAGVNVYEQDSRPYIDFSGMVSKLPITTATNDPVTLQLRKGVQKRMLNDRGPTLDMMYVDSSGNQGLADDMDIYLGPGCGHINNSERASDTKLRAFDERPAKVFIKDRGTEAWAVLAEFCKAGMVRGLPLEALGGLTQRRFAVRPNTTDTVSPLRLEKKEDFNKRFKGSPNYTDACALAALAVKEKMGIIPFGSMPAAQPEGQFPEAYEEYLRDQFEDPDVSASDPGEGYSDDYSDIESWD